MTDSGATLVETIDLEPIRDQMDATAGERKDHEDTDREGEANEAAPIEDGESDSEPMVEAIDLEQDETAPPEEASRDAAIDAHEFDHDGEFAKDGDASPIDAEDDETPSIDTEGDETSPIDAETSDADESDETIAESEIEPEQDAPPARRLLAEE